MVYINVSNVEGKMVVTKKTIVISSNTSWFIYNFRLNLLKELASQGYTVNVIAPKDIYSNKLEKLGFNYYEIEINSKGTNPLEDIILIYSFYKLYKRISPDIILLNTIKPNIYGSMAAGILGIPAISNITGLGTVFIHNKISSKIAKILYKLALYIPRTVFYQNADDRNVFVESNLVKKEKTDLLPGSGIDTKKFKPSNKKFKKKDTFRFLFIGRLLRDKGLVEYIEASRRISNSKNVECCVLGSFYSENPSAISEDDMNRWVSDGCINYIGASNDVKSVIAEYDCIVLPSYREGLSRVLLESASMAKPIITTNVPGCKEVVEDRVNGYLCKPRNINDLTNKMQLMINLNDEKRKIMGENGRKKIIKEFDEKLVIDKYLNVIGETFSNL